MIVNLFLALFMMYQIYVRSSIKKGELYDGKVIKKESF
ncbi:hypothetical protein M2092_000335 [Fusobacterium sp. PH5-44]